MSSKESTERRIGDLRDAGYSIDGIFVDIPVETSIRRADYRHREGQENFRSGVGMGGRYVPSEIIRAQNDPGWGSKNRRTFESVKAMLDDWSLYDNSVDFHAPRLIEASRVRSDIRKETDEH